MLSRWQFHGLQQLVSAVVISRGFTSYKAKSALNTGIAVHCCADVLTAEACALLEFLEHLSLEQQGTLIKGWAEKFDQHIYAAVVEARLEGNILYQKCCLSFERVEKDQGSFVLGDIMDNPQLPAADLINPSAKGLWVFVTVRLERPPRNLGMKG